ncbi:MAG: radical SAM protein [Candidatus Scatovivens sp.]
MKFQKEENTKVRFEKDGIYIMNYKYQTKEKITDLQEEGKMFYNAIHSVEIEDISKIESYLKKKFIIPIKSYEDEFETKTVKCTSTPIYMTIGITSNCNYNCKHCGNNSNNKKETDLGQEEIYDLIDQMVEMNLLKLNFTGGEPTTDIKLVDYIRYAKGKIPRITLTTNGSLITKEKAKELKRAGLNMAKISIDGISEFHNEFRNYKGAYEKAILAIKNFKENEIEVRVQSTLTKYNQKDLIKLMEILSDLQISHHTIVPVCPIGRADVSMMLSKEEYREFIKEMYEKVKELNKKETKTHFQIRPIFGAKELFNEQLQTSFETLSIKYSCEALKNTMEIKPNGEVVPCSFLDIPIGNVRKNSLLEIWNQIKADEMRKKFKQNNKNEECLKCKKNNICNGGCIANKYYYYKDFNHKDPYCFI